MVDQDGKYTNLWIYLLPVWGVGAEGCGWLNDTRYARVRGVILQGGFLRAQRFSGLNVRTQIWRTDDTWLGKLGDDCKAKSVNLKGNLTDWNLWFLAYSKSILFT